MRTNWIVGTARGVGIILGVVAYASYVQSGLSVSVVLAALGAVILLGVEQSK